MCQWITFFSPTETHKFICKMRSITTFILLLFAVTLVAQSKNSYLKENRFDLRSTPFEFPQEDIKIIGFGAYHGSVKTEDVEYQLMNSLLKKGQIKYYIIETDYSIGRYFNEFLETGDTVLLKDLVCSYGIRVPQEKSVETYKKWKKLKRLHDGLPAEKKFTVVGIDPIVSYKYTFRHLVELIGKQENWATVGQIKTQIQLDTTDFSPNYDSAAKQLLKDWVKEYEANRDVFNEGIKDLTLFEHLLSTIKKTFEPSNREQNIYDNYVSLDSYYNFKKNPQFARYGFGHLEKTTEGYPTFFNFLIENGFYKKNEIITIIGYLTKSRVLWNLVYDENGNYKSYHTEGGFGIGDYWKEYFRGIKRLKKNKLSDLTLFRLNKENSPYTKGKPDLIEIKMLFDKSNKSVVKGKPTTMFIDYAVLISNSEAQSPIEELN